MTDQMDEDVVEEKTENDLITTGNEGGKDTEMDLLAHLERLQKQSEQNAHLIAGEFDSKAATQPVVKRGRGRPKGAGRSRITEEEEDSLLVKSSQSEQFVVWLEKQPSILVGGILRSCKISAHHSELIMLFEFDNYKLTQIIN